MQKIVVVGSINMDLVANVHRMPLSGETITATSFASFGGGKGANQAVAAARLGGNVAMVGRLGRDAFGDQLRQQLNEEGIDTSAIRDVDGATGCAVITVAADGTNSIIVVPGANGSLDEQELELHIDTVLDASLILAQLEVPLQTVTRLARMAYENGTPFVLDPAPAAELPMELLRSITWITPNESETISILRFLGEAKGISSITADTAPIAAESILSTGVRNVILKMGAQGVYATGADVKATYLPALPVNVIDTTAAGDAFNGGFAFAMTKLGLPPAKAIRFASAVASLSVTRKGAQPSMPGLFEVEAMLSRSASTT